MYIFFPPRRFRDAFAKTKSSPSHRRRRRLLPTPTTQNARIGKWKGKVLGAKKKPTTQLSTPLGWGAKEKKRGRNLYKIEGSKPNADWNSGSLEGFHYMKIV